MLQGKVNEDHEPVLDLTVLAGTDQETAFRVVVDSGFNGFLTLPPSAIHELELVPIGKGTVELADGNEVSFPIYQAEVMWDGKRLTIPVDAADTDPLIGMALMNGYELRIQVKRGGRVLLEAMT